ncbi:MAG: hypothetical protein WCA37_01405 [Terracidiphilus sp.]
MRRLAGLLALYALGLCGAGWAATPDVSSRESGGVVVIRFDVSLPVSLAPGASILCRAKVMPDGRAEPGGSDGQVVTAMGMRHGSMADCAVEMPVWWQPRGGDSGAQLSYEVDALVSSGGAASVVRVAAEQGVTVAPQRAGGAATRWLSRVR